MEGDRVSTIKERNGLIASPNAIMIVIVVVSGLLLVPLVAMQHPPMLMLLVSAGILLLLFTRNPEVGFYVILFTIPFEDIAFLTPALSLSMFLGVILALSWLINLLGTRKKGLLPAGFSMIALFLMYGLLTITWAPDTSRALEVLVRFAMLAVFYVIGINLLNSDHKARIALKFLIAGSIAAAGYALLLFYRGEARWEWAALGIVGSPLHLGMRSAIALLFLFIANPWRGSRYSGLVKYIGILILFSAMIASRSRGPLLGLLGALAILMLIARKKIRWTPILLCIGVVGALGLVIPEIRQTLEFFWHRLGIEYVIEGRGGGRFDLIIAGTHMFFDNARNFLFGVGIGNFPIVIDRFILDPALLGISFSPHNIYLGIVTELGVIGILLGGAMLLLHVKKGWQAVVLSKTTGITWDYYLAVASFTVFICLLIAGTTLDAIYHRYFWVSMMFVQLSFIFAKENKRSLS